MTPSDWDRECRGERVPCHSVTEMSSISACGSVRRWVGKRSLHWRFRTGSLCLCDSWECVVWEQKREEVGKWGNPNMKGWAQEGEVVQECQRREVRMLVSAPVTQGRAEWVGRGWLWGEPLLSRVESCAFQSSKQEPDLVCVAPESTEELRGTQFCFRLWNHFHIIKTHNTGFNKLTAFLAASSVRAADCLPVRKEILIGGGCLGTLDDF